MDQTERHQQRKTHEALHRTGVNHGNHSHNKGHLFAAASSSVERPPNGGSQLVQFIPIVVSETQKANRAGRTLCKVVGCSRVDFSYTNGFCKYHHGLLYRGPVIYHQGERERDGAESWDCTCGQKISATKKRCWSCFKWRGGVKGTKSETACAGDVSLPKPKKARSQKSKKFSGASPMRKRHNPKIHPDSAGKSKDESLLRSRNIPAFNSSTSSHLDIKKVRIAKKCSERWRSLLMVTNHRRALSPAKKDDAVLKDPFDCSDLIISPTIELVEREVAKAIQRWQDLDSRIVLEEDGSAGFYDGTSDGNFFIMDGTFVGDGRRQRLLPLNFDYKCERLSGDHPGCGSASDSVEEHEKLHNYRPRVVSLLDPAQTLDYETELWHVFYSMPTASDLERRHALQSNKCEKQQVVTLPLGCRRTLQIKSELKTHLSEHTRMDAHSLGRMRIRDRHSTPISLISQLRSDLSCLRFAGRDCQTKSYLKTSIRFEILRHSVNLKRGSGRDSNRLEVELSVDHTLLDLHRLLAECASAAEGQGAGYIKESEERCDIAPAGVFFIENNFYTHGVTGEHVGRTILQWLNGHQTKDESGNSMKQATVSSRRNHLFLSSSCDLMPMSAIYLETLPLRLGMRYVHMFIDHSSLNLNKPSLCKESALFVTDIRTHPRLSSFNPDTQDHLKNSVVISRAPVIHDAWTPLKQIASCSACNSAAATVVTMNDELTDLSSTVTAAHTVRKSSTFNSVEFQGVMLCACCFRDLHYVESVGNNILRLRSSHMVFRALPVDVFNKLSLAKATEKIPKSALF